MDSQHKEDKNTVERGWKSIALWGAMSGERTARWETSRSAPRRGTGWRHRSSIFVSLNAATTLWWVLKWPKASA